MKFKLKMNKQKMLSFLTSASFCIGGVAFVSSASAQTPLQCTSIFSPYSDLLIPMNPQYRGEDVGLYVDQSLNQRWYVKYFTPQERRHYQLKLNEAGLFIDINGVKASTKFDAETGSFESSLFVINKNFDFYILPFEKRGKFHHSSLAAGDDAIFAGTAIFVDGRLREITNYSGHYKPDTQQTLAVIERLRLLGVDLSAAKLSGPAAKEVSGVHSLLINEIRK